MAAFVIFISLLFEVHASKCKAPDPKKFPMRWTDKIAAFNCMPEETKTQDPYRFEYYCREPNCFSLYENQATHYQWDSTCRKCIPCTVNECRPPNLDTGPKFPCEKTKEGCTTEKPVNCGEHGTNANSYSCKCDPGWKNNVQAGTFCDIVEVKGDATLAANPEEDAKTQQTTTYVILILVGVFLVLLALCSCCFAYFCKRSKENQEVLRFVRQGGHADNSASSGVAKQVQFMKMNSRKVRSQRRQLGSELNSLLSISFMSDNLQNPNNFLCWKLRTNHPHTMTESRGVPDNSLRRDNIHKCLQFGLPALLACLYMVT